VHFSQYCNKNKNKKIAQHPVLRFNPKKKSNENEERERERESSPLKYNRTPQAWNMADSHHLLHHHHSQTQNPQRKRETKMRSERKKLAQKSPKSSQKQRTQFFTFEQPVHEKLRDGKKPK
jgi:hypothetical protein